MTPLLGVLAEDRKQAVAGVRGGQEGVWEGLQSSTRNLGFGDVPMCHMSTYTLSDMRCHCCL